MYFLSTGRWAHNWGEGLWVGGGGGGARKRKFKEWWNICICTYIFCIVYGRFAKVLFANFWSRFAYVLGQFPNCFCLITGWKNEVDTCVSHFFVSWLREGSFRFLAERHKTLAKRLPGETTGHHLVSRICHSLIFKYLIWEVLFIERAFSPV